eukprot:s33_g23.t1
MSVALVSLGQHAKMTGLFGQQQLPTHEKRKRACVQQGALQSRASARSRAVFQEIRLDSCESQLTSMF